LPLNGIRASVVLLEASADSIKFVTNTSPGKIAGEHVLLLLLVLLLASDGGGVLGVAAEKVVLRLVWLVLLLV
jgi:hypothetical protein